MAISNFGWSESLRLSTRLFNVSQRRTFRVPNQFFANSPVYVVYFFHDAIQ